MYWTCCDIKDFSPEILRQAYDRLSPSRKEHIDLLRRREDQVRSLAAEILVYRLLQTHYAITDASLHRRENGQPYLTGCRLHVSISHCDQLVACAISEEPVGIDIERIRPVKQKLWRHVCVEEELADLLAGEKEPETPLWEDPRLLRRFFEIWAAKEAYFKKQGTGITDLKSVNVLNLPRQTHLVGEYMLQIM